MLTAQANMYVICKSQNFGKTKHYLHLKKIYYKSKLLNLYTFVYFAYIFLHSVKFKTLFNSNKAFS